MRTLQRRPHAFMVLVGFLFSWLAHPAASTARSTEVYDIVIYGGTSAAVTAAIQADRMGMSVIIVSPDRHWGGLTSGGLGWTDTGDKSVIGGLAREFYHRIWQAYQEDEAWRWQSRESYGNRGQGTPAIDGQQRTMWIFEPHIAEQVYDQWLKETAVPFVTDARLLRDQGVKIRDGRISSITTLDGKQYHGRVFMDATYEGDLMAASGVSYHVGRESQETYGETWNGVQTGVLHHRHHFGVLDQPIDPYLIPGNPQSGLLPRVHDGSPGEFGAGDHRIQAYCFRMCLTDVEENRIPFPKPDNYDPKEYALLGRIFEAGWRESFSKFDPIPNGKTDTNNHGPFSTDNIGFNYDYPEASYERRQEIIREHRDYQMGLMYFLANDPQVPEEVRQQMSRWGLSRDEFTDNGHWPHQIYVREARRMIGDYIMTEHELLKRRATPESIGMGSYTMDSHNVQRYITPEGHVQNEGDIGVSTRGPYEIARGAVLPREDECTNLVVPVCVSSSHIAFGSIRMEPVFMILGQSAATIAAMAIKQQVPVQHVAYDDIKRQLLADGQVLESDRVPTPSGGITLESLPGIVVDDTSAIRSGKWTASQSVGKWVEFGYQHDGDARDGQNRATFRPKLPRAGEYEVRLAYSPNANRSSQVDVHVIHARGKKRLTIDQRKTPEIDQLWTSLGRFFFDPEKSPEVLVTNTDADGYIIIDAVQWIPIEQD